MGYLDHGLPLSPLRAGIDPLRPLQQTRLLSVSASGCLDGSVHDLPHLLSAGDLLVLNDSATMPASLLASHTPTEEKIEIRLAHHLEADEPDAPFGSRFAAVVFGAGSWRDDTNNRQPPPTIRKNDLLRFGKDDALNATIEAVSTLSNRLVHLRFDRSGDALAREVFKLGKPVQYRHLPHRLALEHIQTPFAKLPWSMEMPSTGRPLSWALIDALETAGIRHAFITHAAGLSATGDLELDAVLPLPERYNVPSSTLELIEHTRRHSGRVVAVGTTVVRALESAALNNAGGGAAIATLRVEEGYVPQLVDGILTGIHAPGESHFDLLHAFASPELLLQAHRLSAQWGYLTHELGDLMLICDAIR